MEDKLDVDGVPLDMLLPTPTPRVKRKEPDNILDAEKQMKSGMNTALPPENKGFKMLMKMGYNPEKDHVEPLKIDLRKGRTGLGRFEEEQLAEEEKLVEDQEKEAKRRKTMEDDALAFQQRQSIAASKKRIIGQLLAMLKVAFQLTEAYRSSARELSESEDPILADPPPLLQEELVKHAFESPGSVNEIRELLASLNLSSQELHHQQLCQYLRQDFLYCFWCGCRYESQEAMHKNCPGPNEIDHIEAIATSSDE